jgi:hypothetical protein
MKKVKHEVVFPKLDRILLSETEKEVWEQLKMQQKKGRERYTVAMSHKQNVDPVAWAQEIIEELVDALQYAVAFKLCLMERKKNSFKHYRSQA